MWFSIVYSDICNQADCKFIKKNKLSHPRNRHHRPSHCLWSTVSDLLWHQREGFFLKLTGTLWKLSLVYAIECWLDPLDKNQRGGETPKLSDKSSTGGVFTRSSKIKDVHKIFSTYVWCLHNNNNNYNLVWWHCHRVAPYTWLCLFKLHWSIDRCVKWFR